jgi:superoxide dismutase, Fe-Mn family
MTILLPELPYAMDALQPHLSKETMEYHYGKHHKAYVDKLNASIPGTKYDAMSLDEIMVASVGDAKVYNNAAQAWNHTFYWNGLAPRGGGEPKGAMADALRKSFGGSVEFVKRFSDVAMGHFGSGWAWLVRKGDGSLDVVATHDAANPMTEHMKPILTCDVWEHAYYIDYRNARARYLDAFWRVINWDFAEKNLRG